MFRTKYVYPGIECRVTDCCAKTLRGAKRKARMRYENHSVDGVIVIEQLVDGVYKEVSRAQNTPRSLWT